ncbi:MAG: hypothetical protein GY742_06745 [Hyphomicrobiales bacterium]|nr:hypothetical protein [Hyphomicrobiales bacterium]
MTDAHIALMRKVVFLLIVTIILTACAPAGIGSNNKETSIDSREFQKKFNNNPDIQESDLRFLPVELQRYLGTSSWKHQNLTGYSRKIESGNYLFVTNRNATVVGQQSKGVILSIRGLHGTVSPDSFLKWRQLFLPSPMPGSIEVTDTHFNLIWNDKLNMVQTSICDDMGGGCSRSSYKILLNNNRLIKIEYKNEFLNPKCANGIKAIDWTHVWEAGEWLIERKRIDNVICLLPRRKF